jgi:hypothetical protein
MAFDLAARACDASARTLSAFGTRLCATDRQRIGRLCTSVQKRRDATNGERPQPVNVRNDVARGRQAMPVRRVVTRGGRRFRGFFPSAKNGCMVPWESLLERDAITLLEYMRTVRCF